MQLTVSENERLTPIAKLLYDGIKQQFEDVLELGADAGVTRVDCMKLLREEFAAQMKLESGIDEVYTNLPTALQSTINATILYNFFCENVPKMLDELEAVSIAEKEVY